MSGFRSRLVYLLHDSCCNFSVDRRALWDVNIKCQYKALEHDFFFFS